MKEEDIPSLQKALNEECGLSEEDFYSSVHIDVPMPISYATKELAEQLSILEPFGVGNPKPLFAEKNIRFIFGTKIGAGKNYARYRVVTSDGSDEQLMFFGNLENFSLFLDKKYGDGAGERLYNESCSYEVSVVYQLSVNTYRGRSEKQFIMQNYC